MKKILTLFIAVVLFAFSFVPVLAEDGYIYPPDQASADKYRGSWLEYLTGDNGAARKLTGFRILFDGILERISTAEISEMRLFRDGNEVKTVTPEKNYTVYAYPNPTVPATDFCVSFTETFSEPGVYQLKYKFQGVQFQTERLLIEGNLTSTPADENAFYRTDCVGSGFGWFVGESGYVRNVYGSVSGFTFYFTGGQDVLHTEDLKEIKCERNGKSIPLELYGQASRNRIETSGGAKESSFDTMFIVDLMEDVKKSGVYIFSGKYRTKDFATGRTIILEEKQLEVMSAAHEWAREKIASALGHELVTDEAAEDLTENITRAEFCGLAVRYIESTSGQNIEDYTAKKSGLYNVSFTDANSEAVLAAAKLGIVSGDGNGIFNPGGFITRQEAAKIIANLQNATGEKISGAESKPPKRVYKDSKDIAKWAESAVDRNAHMKTMEGDGVYFRPLENITREESVIIFENLYRYNENFSAE